MKIKELFKKLRRPLRKEPPKEFENTHWMMTGSEIYHIQYFVTIKMGNGSESSTGIINVSVPANTAEEARLKLSLFVKKKVRVSVASIKKSS